MAASGRGYARTWEYAQTEHIARDYDEYFAFNSLFEFDQEVLNRHFAQPGYVVDLGCGTGRALVPLVRAGFRGLAVDLSAEMLSVVGEKAEVEHLPIDRLMANLVDLDCLRDNIADYCISMFSTLGMIRGRENRQRALGHVRRLLKPGGLFVLHVHNLWYNLYDPGGPWWLVKNLLRAAVMRDQEAGDKFFDYRQIPNMFLHVFRRRELLAALRQAGFRVAEACAARSAAASRACRPWLLPDLRANGWIVVCE